MNGIMGMFKNPKLIAVAVAVTGAIGLWMFITPMYLYIIQTPELSAIPSWGWALMGLGILLLVAHYGKRML